VRALDYITERLRSRGSAPGSEAGFTLAEVVIAMMILMIGTLAVLQIFDASTRSAFRAEQSQAAINVAQREIEEIHNLDYDSVAMTSTPTFMSDPNDPRNRIDGTRFDASDNGALFEMVRDGGSLDEGGTVSGGAVNPGPEEFESGDVTGTISRFVVWRNDPTCDPSVCAGSQDLKRVIVAVKLDDVAVSYDRPYIEVQSDFIDPDASFSSDLPTGNEVNVPQTFWLTDTTCDQTSRQPIDTSGGDLPAEGHALHNTLGACVQGLQTGVDPGAPDLLDVEPPPDEEPNGPSLPLAYDYATDLEPEPDNDRGLQITRQNGDGCSFSGGTGADPHQKVHRWVTKRIQSFPVTSFEMTGSATVGLYLRTLGSAQHAVRVCTYLFRRTSETTSGSTTTWSDVTIDDDSFLVSNLTGDSWQLEEFNLSFPATTIGLDDRLGFAISIERNGTPADTVQVLYDHPEQDGRLEVITSTPLTE
jgi:type II secretory pathway pseudopilin PulG